NRFVISLPKRSHMPSPLESLAPDTVPVLQTEQLGRTYRIARPWPSRQLSLDAVNDVSLTLPSRSTLGVVGESGCGKSTLSRMLVGLLPDRESTRLNSSHVKISYAVFCLTK